ncbi:MAG: EAL domain-containing response regulator [Gallionellaceae bacterium]|nr:EAL domain-containing response regulator [Gallionellaceae bacterium]
MEAEQQRLGFLVVDDDAFMLKVITRSLHALGHDRVVTCSNGVEGLLKLDQNTPPDVILCDLNMPEMDGVEFLRKLAGTGYDGSLVVISGEDQRILGTAESLARAHRLDILGYLGKPFKSEALKEILSRRQPRVQAAAPCAPAEPCSPADIRRGLDAHEFIVYFQPKVELASGGVVCVEALARWQHSVRGMVAPDQFIPVAEQYGLIGALTERVLTDSLQQVQAWRQQGLELKIAINVSMDDLVQLDFPEKVLACAEAAGIRPFDITLEVTESRLMRDPLAPLDILTRLRLKRIGLSIDDFGTGYSNLAQLQNIPFDELKLDRSFVQGAAWNLAAKDILESTVDLAKKLNMTVVAEGVETRADWDLVVALGCDLAQGYFIAKPMPGADLPFWLKTWHVP